MDKIFDSHSHYNDTSFKDDYREVIKHIQESGVSNVVNVVVRDIVEKQRCRKQKRCRINLVCGSGQKQRNEQKRRYRVQ